MGDSWADSAGEAWDSTGGNAWVETSGDGSWAEAAPDTAGDWGAPAADTVEEAPVVPREDGKETGKVKVCHLSYLVSPVRKHQQPSTQSFTTSPTHLNFPPVGLTHSS